jgi:hypothetical protein
MNPKVRILNLEDNARDSELIQLRLEAGGVACELLRVETEMDYLHALGQEDFDLIIADLALPSFDGMRGLEHARQRRPEIPFIFFSGMLGEEVAVDSLHQGAVDYVLKQRPARLVPAIRRALQEAETWRQRQRAEEALRESESKFRTLFDLVPYSLAIHDADDRLVEVNARILKRLARNREAIVGHLMSEFYILSYTGNPIEPVPDGQILQDALRGPVEVHLIGRTSEQRRVVLLSAANVSLGDERGILTCAVDITDLKEAEKERTQLQTQLYQAQKMEAVGRLAGGVAHDFNNLLMVIIGHSDLALKRLNARNPIRRHITEIEKAGQRAAELTGQLLAFSRKQIIQPKVLDLNFVVKDVERMLRRLIGEDITLTIVLSPELGRVKADPSQMSQVLMNLAVNSRDAMPNGGHLTIETANVDPDDTFAMEQTEVRPGPFVRLVVSDSGIGMDAETRAHLFEPFFTTKRTGEGTGLGLATVYGIVKQAGGFIRVHSEPGKGATFQIYLPRVAETAEVKEAAISAAWASYGTETILLVEDQPEVRKLARMVLRSFGYNVLEAADAREALFHSARCAGPIHLLLTDVVMPGMSGHELAAQLKPLRPEMKVLYMSGYTASAIVRQEILEAGINYLQKPVSRDNLAAKVREVLGPPRPAGTVLVVDDEVGIRSLVRQVLQSAGYDVLEAENGKQAIREAENQKVDLVITDLAMPEQEGIGTIQLLRAERPGLKIIAMSGATSVQDYLDVAKTLGAHASLARPVQPDQLLETVRRILSE